MFDNLFDKYYLDSISLGLSWEKKREENNGKKSGEKLVPLSRLQYSELLQPGKQW